MLGSGGIEHPAAALRSAQSRSRPVRRQQRQRSRAGSLPNVDRRIRRKICPGAVRTFRHKVAAQYFSDRSVRKSLCRPGPDGSDGRESGIYASRLRSAAPVGRPAEKPSGNPARIDPPERISARMRTIPPTCRHLFGQTILRIGRKPRKCRLRDRFYRRTRRRLRIRCGRSGKGRQRLCPDQPAIRRLHGPPRTPREYCRRGPERTVHRPELPRENRPEFQPGRVETDTRNETADGRQARRGCRFHDQTVRSRPNSNLRPMPYCLLSGYSVRPCWILSPAGGNRRHFCRCNCPQT